ncbi:MAG TPA: LUD domain-containing protein [Patescibacteria group bacterium]|nr:LUD domain-containing protein [Patescibacteria group bacterium]
MAAPPTPESQYAAPRAVANKRDKQNLLSAIRMALGIESAAVRRNTQTFNRNRYREAAALADYDALKDEARAIKERSITNLPELLNTLERAVRSRGGHFYLASTAADACRYILGVCQSHSAKLVVKGKSITSEEIRLNHVLQGAGIEVAESDLAEFILQVADEQPSHNVAPAMHYSTERISGLFKRKFSTDEPLETGEELTKFARGRLRQKFLNADVGFTGANLIAADTGTIMLVESEGNIRMSSLLPPVHISLAGVEKVIPSQSEMGVFLELLPLSFNGKLTSYTSFIRPPLDDPPFALAGRPRKKREFHLVLIDNGRMKMRQDPVLQESLYCIRCSACMNSCANFQTVGGHAFGGETYCGGIGGAWEAATGALENARFSDLCTGCSRCVTNCPVRIDIPWLNEVLRDRLNRASAGSPLSSLLGAVSAVRGDDRRASAQKIFFANYHWYAKWGTRTHGLSNALMRNGLARSVMQSLLGVDIRRELPAFPARTLVRAARELPPPAAAGTSAKAVLFADVYTNYGLPERGIAALKVLRSLGADVVVSDAFPEGRAALSQGMIATARRQARRTADRLGPYLDQGRDVIVIEPSALAMFRRDYNHLLVGASRYDLLRTRSFEPVEYVARIIAKSGRPPRDIFDVSRSPVGPRLFYHSHCQQKTLGCAAPTENLLREIGFDVATSSVECCGMAGSFGYKREYYEMSMAVGGDLYTQVQAADQPDAGGPRALIASGTSCTEQLHAGLSRPVMHPIELLAAILKL